MIEVEENENKGLMSLSGLVDNFYIGLAVFPIGIGFWQI